MDGPHAASGAHEHGHGHGPADRDSWDERYRASTVWSGEPNAALVAEVAGLVPGRALDAGCGEGADAIWLAEHGWQVTAVDFAAVAVDRAAALASDVGVGGRIAWIVADLTTWEPPRASFDLVCALFLHLTPKRRAVAHRRLAGAVASGGVLLVVEHSVADLATTVRRPADPTLYAAAAGLAAALPGPGWEVVAAERRPRDGRDDEGRPVTLHDEVLVARRR